jgi:hypothetical protein
VKPAYSEGSVFLVPLRSGGYVHGVVARAASHGRVLLGYFFGPRLESADSVVPADLDPENAILRVRFGDLGLLNGEWPIVGQVQKWNRAQWPMPDFVRRDPLGKMKARIVRYSDDDPNRIEDEHPVDGDLGIEADSLHGYGAIEIRLTNLTRARK